MSGELKKKTRRLVIAGGGTGGHVLAGIAVADAWKKRFGSASQENASAEMEIAFVGASGGIEERLVPLNGYPLTLLEIGALNRVSLGRKLRTLLKLPFALLRSALWLIRFRPDAVLGVGGYASGPLVLMARVFSRAHTAILEQNSVPGFTNRILGRVARTVFTAFPGMDRHFPGRSAGRLIVSGNPVRSHLSAMPAAVMPPWRFFVFGGSQGAMGVNQAVLEAAQALKAQGLEVSWVHQTGERDFERVRAQYAQAGFDVGGSVQVSKFIDDMGAQYRAASVVICRAGSSTLSEIAAVGRAAVLVPFPQASDNHQEENAKVFVERGAAVMIRQGEQAGAELAEFLGQCIADPSRIAAMEKAVATLARRDAAQVIVNVLSGTEGPAS